MTMSAYLIPFKVTYLVEDYDKLHVREIFRLHGVPVLNIFDRGTQFTSELWKFVYKDLGTHVKISTTFHPQTDGQAEHIMHTLEDMFRYYLIDFKNNWDVHLPLVELAYNNNFLQLFICVPLSLFMV